MCWLHIEPTVQGSDTMMYHLYSNAGSKNLLLFKVFLPPAFAVVSWHSDRQENGVRWSRR